MPNLAPSRHRLKPNRDTLLTTAIVLLHVAVALYVWLGQGVYIGRIDFEITPDDLWNGSPQRIPLELSRFQLFESLWHLHGQPPLYNLFVGLLGRWFYPHYLEAIQISFIAAGAALSAAIYHILVRLLSRRKLAFFIGAALALNPVLLLFEAFFSYEVFSAALLVLTALCLALHRPEKSLRFLYLAVVLFNILMLTRSFYHIILLALLWGLVALMAGRQWRKVLIVSLLISLPTFGWYTKNDLQYGFWGGSSWFGQNLWRIVGAGYTDDELANLEEQGIIEPLVAEVKPLTEPSAYQKYGFTETSPIDLLASDTLHNINIIEISRAYGRSASRLIRHDPAHYFGNVYLSYRLYNQSPTVYGSVLTNTQRILPLERIYTLLFKGQLVTDLLARIPGVDDFGSLTFFVLPLLLLIDVGKRLQHCGLSPSRWVMCIRSDPAMIFIALMLAYTALVGSVLEYGENNRFAVMVEQLYWVFLVVIVDRILRRTWRAVYGLLDSPSGGSARPSRSASR